MRCWPRNEVRSVMVTWRAAQSVARTYHDKSLTRLSKIKEQHCIQGGKARSGEARDPECAGNVPSFACWD
jgi:hypothetical protein